MHFPQVSAKTLPPTFSMVHLLHRLYGVDAPGTTVLFFHLVGEFDARDSNVEPPLRSDVSA